MLQLTQCRQKNDVQTACIVGISALMKRPNREGGISMQVKVWVQDRSMRETTDVYCPCSIWDDLSLSKLVNRVTAPESARVRKAAL